MAKLYFYYSAMNAGKSTVLLQSSYNYQERGMKTLVFAPKLYSRAGAGYVSSRIGLKAQASVFDESFDFFDHVQALLADSKVHCVLIDEAQFLSKVQVLQLTRICDELNIPCLTYGLRTDFQGETFQGSQYLLAWADELAEIKTICRCGKKASMNMRIDNEGRQVHQGDQVGIGGNELYVATCRKHFCLLGMQLLLKKGKGDCCVN